MLNKRRSGLGSLIPGAEIAPGSGPAMASITAIAVNPYQPRRAFAPEALDELADSIRQYGVLQPLTVRLRDDGYELIAGERRLQASRKAGLREVPVIVRECSDEEMLALALVENLQREDLNAMEAARSYHQLIGDFGLSQTEVSERVGKSRSAVANTLRLLALPASMQSAVEAGAISEGHARALLAVEDADRRDQLFTETREKGLSVRALEGMVSPRPKPTARRKPAPPEADANLQQVETDLQTSLGTRVRFKPGSTLATGSLEIEYYSPDDLDRIYEALRR
jgi:ParB family chromosome partitioning protein